MDMHYMVSPASICSSTCSGSEPLGISGPGFVCQMSFRVLTLQCQSTELLRCNLDRIGFVYCRAQRLAALTSFLKSVPSAEVTPSSVGSVIVDDSLVKLIEEEVVRTTVSDATGFVIPCISCQKYCCAIRVCCNSDIYFSYHAKLHLS